MINNQISKSLPTNHLGFYNPEGDVQVDKISSFLGIARTHLAEALGLPSDHLRQARLTGKAKERVEQLASAIEYVSETFDGDEKQTIFWLKAANLNFGGFSPIQLIIRGKYKKVLEFILDARASS